MDLSQITNISESLRMAAANFPHQAAVAEPVGRTGNFRTITFAELERRAAQIAAGVRAHGVGPDTKICLMVPPGIDFVAWVFGLFRAETTVVLIDPGMGRKNMIRCLAETNPDGVAGIGLAQIARWVYRKQLPQCRLNFCVGRRALPLGIDTRPFFAEPTSTTQTTTRDARPSHDAEHQAAIIFTTGSTGPPKGVLYRHRHFIQQTIQIRDYFGIEPGGADVSGFPLFALFNTGMGMTTIFPRMDATRPAKIDPRDFIQAVEHFQANQSFGSPALWNTVLRFCNTNGKKLPTLRRVLSAGAPVPVHVLEGVRQMIHSDGEVHTPYGATESLPVACIESRKVIEETSLQSRNGAGTCVGKRWPQIEWRVIEINDGPLTDISQTVPVPPGQIGELMVSGNVVTDRYVTRTDANALHKVADGGRIWHRMGDVGYLDEQDRFWFCGRKSHRVQTARGTLFTIPCEAIINNHPRIYRSALVGVGPPGQQRPAIIAEPWPDDWPKRAADQSELLGELRELGAGHELTKEIEYYFLMKSLPVDIRHNAKIFREQLREWAAKRM